MLCTTPWSCGGHGFAGESFFNCLVASKIQPVSSFSLQVTVFDSDVLHIQAFKQLHSCTGKVMLVSCKVEGTSVWAGPEHVYNDWRASLLADVWAENQLEKVRAGRNSVLESIQLVYKELPNAYVTYVCSLKDHSYYQAPDDDEVVKDCEEHLFSLLQLLFLYSKANARGSSQ